MSKVVNLDAIAEKIPTSSFKWKGVVHIIPPMTVENFIATTRAVQGIDDVTDPTAQVETAIGILTRSVPTLSKEDLHGTPLQILMAMTDLVRGIDVDDGTEKQEAGAEAEGGEGNANPA